MKGFWDSDRYADDYQNIPEVNAVINLEARAFSSGVLKVVNDKGETQEKDEMQIRLQSPNWFQDQKEFMRQTRLNRNVYGDEYIYAIAPAGMPDKPKAIYTLPPNLVEAKYTGSKLWYEFFNGEVPQIDYTYKIKNEKRKLIRENLIHFNDNKIGHGDDQDFFKGESKLKALAAVRFNLRASYESRGVILKHRGALGILSNNQKDVAGSVSIDPTEKERLQNEYAGKYGGLEGQYNLIITDADLRWQQMSVSPDRLGLFEETEAGLFKVCDAYGVPVELFSSKNKVAYENQRQARKGLYTEQIIPSANEWAAGLNQRYMKNSKNKIVVDYMHLAIFQEDLRERANTLQTMVNALSKMLQDGVITIVEYKEELIRFGIGVK